MRGAPPAWFFAAAGVVALAAAALYLEKAFGEGPAARNVVIAMIWVGLGLVWLRTFRGLRRTRTGSDRGARGGMGAGAGEERESSRETRM